MKTIGPGGAGFSTVGAGDADASSGAYRSLQQSSRVVARTAAQRTTEDDILADPRNRALLEDIRFACFRLHLLDFLFISSFGI